MDGEVCVRWAARKQQTAPSGAVETHADAQWFSSMLLLRPPEHWRRLPAATSCRSRLMEMVVKAAVEVRVAAVMVQTARSCWKSATSNRNRLL